MVGETYHVIGLPKSHSASDHILRTVYFHECRTQAKKQGLDVGFCSSAPLHSATNDHTRDEISKAYSKLIGRIKKHNAIC